MDPMLTALAVEAARGNPDLQRKFRDELQRRADIARRPAPKAMPFTVQIKRHFPEHVPLQPEKVERFVSAQRILRAVAKVSRLSVQEITGPRRWRLAVHWRFIAIWLIRQNCPKLGTPAIGKTMGGRDHCTIFHALRVVGDNLERFSADIARVEALLQERSQHG